MAKTSTAQRVFIWIIAAAMIVGSLGFYFLIIMSNGDTQDDSQQQAELQKMLACSTATSEVKAPAKPESIKFDKKSVTKLKTKDIKVGTGQEVTSTDDCVEVFYQGNLSDGKVFDENYSGSVTNFLLNQVIVGWQQGMIGMKVGGTRVIYVPSDLAYGEAGSSPDIGPNEPLVFTVDLVGIKD